VRRRPRPPGVRRLTEPAPGRGHPLASSRRRSGTALPPVPPPPHLVRAQWPGVRGQDGPPARGRTRVYTRRHDSPTSRATRRRRRALRAARRVHSAGRPRPRRARDRQPGGHVDGPGLARRDRDDVHPEPGSREVLDPARRRGRQGHRRGQHGGGRETPRVGSRRPGATRPGRVHDPLDELLHGGRRAGPRHDHLHGRGGAHALPHPAPDTVCGGALRIAVGGAIPRSDGGTLAVAAADGPCRLDGRRPRPDRLRPPGSGRSRPVAPAQPIPGAPPRWRRA
jgi:hypothetical protein